MKLNCQKRWTKVAGFTLRSIALIAMLWPPIAAQSQEAPKGATNAADDGARHRAATMAATAPEAEQLKERLKKLEQMVSELKRQLESVEKPPVTTGVAAGETNSAPIIAPKAAAKPPLGQGNKGENTFEVYGFAMLDTGYQFNTNHPDWFDVVRPTKLPSFKGEFAPEGKVFFGVRQSRLGVKSSTQTKLGELKTQFEFELFGTGVDAGQTTFRLRHAYGELGQFGAGQYWTVFGDTDVYPNSLEYWGPNGLVWFRNVQIRWMPLKGKNAVTIALERPGASGDQGVLADRIELQGIKPRFDLPDLTGHVRFVRDWGHVQIAGLVRRIRWADVTDDAFDLGGSDVGWGVSVGSSLKFGKHDVGRVQATYGEGIENYLNDAPVDVAIKRTNSTNPRRPIKGVAVPVFGMSAFLDHNWNKRFTSAIGYSLVNLENTDGQAPAAFHRGHYALANLLFYPVENVLVGGEFQWGRRENFRDGFASNDYRVQFSFKYNFSKAFAF
jgi:hypothetical protein